MEPEYDIYAKLRPWTEIEACGCAELTGLLLVNLLTDNPIHCIECRREVAPERLSLTCEEVDTIATWFVVEQALYSLWLDSSDYEVWAKEKMTDKTGQVVRRGLNAAAMLSKRLPTYYWWFYDSDDGQPETCPLCGGKLNEDVKHGTGQCETCKIRI
jgi:hypothetical protein